MKIKEYRLAYQLTQEDVAKELGICSNQYSRKEKGYYPFTIEEYRKLFIIFNRYNKLDAGKFFLEA